MVYIFDTSFIGSLIIPDENNQTAKKMYDKIENEDIIQIPQLFWYEISNTFKNLLRRKRFKEDEVMQFYPRLAAMQLINDNVTGVEYSKKLLRLCNKYNISSYDAAYLELAERKKAVLCTFDENLRLAAKKCGVSVIR